MTLSVKSITQDIALSVMSIPHDMTESVIYRFDTKCHTNK
jgi:hypothetical protein